MDITAISRVAPDPHAPPSVAPVDRTAEVRGVVQAVKAVNGTEMFGPENELRFQKDPESHRMVMLLVNRQTSEVVSQVPEEYVLRLAEDLKQR